MLCSNMFGVIVSAILLSTLTDVQSRYVRHPEIHRSVVHKKVIATWDEAKRRCEAEGAVMASPLDEEMLEYMRSSIGADNHTTTYFLGMKATGNPELVFTSLEGVPLDDLPEAAINMIDQLDPQDGDCLGMDRHNIQVVSCKARLPYICYRNDTSTFTSTSTTTAPVDVTTDLGPEETTATKENCSSGYTYLSDSYYKLHQDPRSWEDARQICSAEGGYLAVINDGQEARTVTEFGTKISRDGFRKYIGLHNENGKWRSVLGHPVNQIYHTWSTLRTNQRCGTIDNDGYLDDIDCTFSLQFICEKEC